MPDFTRTFELVRRTARPPEQGAVSEVETGALSGIDWPLAIALAQFHRVEATLAAHVAALGPEADVPEKARGTLEAASVEGVRRALFLATEMSRLADALTKADIPFSILKGPSLAEAYGGVGLRPFVDNDILIDSGDLNRLGEVMGRAGFTPKHTSRRSLHRHAAIHGECVFERHVGDRRSAVDVHTRALPLGYRFQPTASEIRAGGRTVELAGRRVPAPSWETAFVFQCAQAMKDQWHRLRLGADVAEVGRVVDDWDGVERLAAGGGVRRAVHVAVLVARGTVRGAFPPEVVAAAERDGRAVAVARSAVSAFPRRHLEGGWTAADRLRLTLTGQDGPRGVARYLGYVALRRVAG